jgi:hypothetical protein
MVVRKNEGLPAAEFEALLEALDALTDEEANDLLERIAPRLNLILARRGQRIAIVKLTEGKKA